MKFLIVDDSPADRELIMRRLRQAFDDVDFVEVGGRSDFEQALSQTDFDLVLSDYYLHWGDGLELFAEIREQHPETPVVMFTDSGSEDVAVAGMKMGLSDYVRKHDLNRLPVAVHESMVKAQLQSKYEKTARQLQLSEQRYRLVSELVSDYAYSYQVAHDGTLSCEWITDAFERITGYTEAEMKAAEDPMFLVHPDDVELVAAHRQRLLEGEHASTSYRIRTRDGDVRWLRVTERPIYDGDGSINRIIGAAQDITEQRTAQEALIQTEKLSLTGTLAASIAHEMNNPMQAVMGSLDLAADLLRDGQELARVNDLLEIARSEVQRIAGIISELRELNRPSKPKDRELISLEAILDRALALVGGEIDSQKVKIDCELPPDLPALMVVPDRLHQVLLNLILNAEQAMDDAGLITIRAYKTENPSGVRITVGDTGVGIPKEDQEKLFEPFFTTKKAGIGLGLYVTRNIVEEHGGSIAVESQIGAGTTFSLWLPTGDQSFARQEGTGEISYRG